MMRISIENYSWKTNQTFFLHYKKFLLEETLETIKTFWKLIKSTLKWEKKSHAHLLQCSERIVLTSSSWESFNININVIKSGILHRFILRRLLTEICVFSDSSCILSFFHPVCGFWSWAVLAGMKQREMSPKGKKPGCRLHCCCSRPPSGRCDLLPGHFFTRTMPVCIVKGMPSCPRYLLCGCVCICVRVSVYGVFSLFTLTPKG